MSKEIFGEYAAFDTSRGVRFHRNNRLVAEAEIPPEAAVYLRAKLKKEQPSVVKPEPKFPRPTPEQIAKMREESLQVPEHLQLTPEEAAARTQITVEEEPLTDKDFDEQAYDAMGVQTGEPQDLSGEIDPDYMDTISIYTAPLESIVQALFDRFGIYTVYLGKFPESDEINPLTGETFTKYHIGIAYQAAIRAANQGILTRDHEEGRRAIDAGRAASANFQEQFVPQPRTMGEARRANSFDYRTSVKGMNENADGVSQNGATSHYDADEDEPIVEPGIGRQVIRPDW